MTWKICGWTVLRSEKQWSRWVKRHYCTYPGRPPEYPCLVRDQITADENSEAFYLTYAEVHKMEQALLQWKK
jgi:hypothetical protein